MQYCVSAAEARSKEEDIYTRAHTSPEIYLDAAIGFVRRLVKKASSRSSRRQSREQREWISTPLASGSSSSKKNNKISAAQLQSFFKIDWDDILSEEARFALAQCAKCRSREIYAVTAQLRSADEGMSVIATCQRCGERWSQR